MSYYCVQHGGSPACEEKNKELGETCPRCLVSVRPTVVCLCGSTRFKDEYIAAAKDETLKGKIVLSVGLWGHIEGLDMNGPVKKMLDELHLRKIDLADEVLFLNVGGYIGESTKRELIYARNAGKIIRFLEEVGDET